MLTRRQLSALVPFTQNPTTKPHSLTKSISGVNGRSFDRSIVSFRPRMDGHDHASLLRRENGTIDASPSHFVAQTRRNTQQVRSVIVRPVFRAEFYLTAIKIIIEINGRSIQILSRPNRRNQANPKFFFLNPILSPPLLFLSLSRSTLNQILLSEISLSLSCTLELRPVAASLSLSLVLSCARCPLNSSFGINPRSDDFHPSATVLASLSRPGSTLHSRVSSTT